MEKIMKIPLTTVAALKNITLANPCPASWDKMKGNEQVRYCDQCRQNVYNLSEMNAADAVQLIEQTEGRLCVQFYRRPDGTVITADCPGGLRWRIWKWLGRRRAWLASLFAILVLPACGGMQRQTDLFKSSEPVPQAPASGKADQGDAKAPAPAEQNKSAAISPGVKTTD
jgi:hypothetical protein